MKRLRRLLAGVCLAALLATVMMPAKIQAEEVQTQENTSVEAKGASGISIMSEGNKVPTFEAGKSTTWTLIVHNNSGVDLTDAVLSPSLGNTNEEWPFNTEYQSYAKELNIESGKSQEVSFEFTQREDVTTSRHTLQFNIYVQGGQDAVVSQKFYVNTTAKPAENPEPPADNIPAPNPGDQIIGDGMDFPSVDAGGFSNGGASISGGGGSEGSTSVPRVIVTGFKTDPEEVRAGGR